MSTSETTPLADHGPRVPRSVRAYLLYPARNGEAMYAVGCARRGAFIVLRESQRQDVLRLLRLMDGSRSPAELASLIAQETRTIPTDGGAVATPGAEHERWASMVDRMTAKLSRAGLIGDGRDATGAAGDIHATSFVLFRMGLRPAAIRVRRWMPWGAPLWARMLTTLCVIGAAGFLAGLIAAALRPYSAASPSGPTSPLAPLAPAIWWLMGAWVSLLLHELSHAAAAVREGIDPASINVALFLGLIPVVYVRIPAIYTVAPRARARIWSAGMHCNGAIAAVLGAAWILLPPGTLAGFAGGIALLNLVMIKVNLLPFYKTDGYFLAGLLFREPNLQERAWRAMGTVWRTRHARPRWVLLAYGVGIIAAAVIGIAQTIRWAVHHFGIAGAALGVLAPVLSVLWARLIRQRLHPWWERVRARLEHAQVSGWLLARLGIPSRRSHATQ